VSKVKDRWVVVAGGTSTVSVVVGFEVVEAVLVIAVVDAMADGLFGDIDLALVREVNESVLNMVLSVLVGGGVPVPALDVNESSITAPPIGVFRLAVVAGSAVTEP